MSGQMYEGLYGQSDGLTDEYKVCLLLVQRQKKHKGMHEVILQTLEEYRKRSHLTLP